MPIIIKCLLMNILVVLFAVKKCHNKHSCIHVIEFSLSLIKVYLKSKCLPEQLDQRILHLNQTAPIYVPRKMNEYPFSYTLANYKLHMFQYLLI